MSDARTGAGGDSPSAEQTPVGNWPHPTPGWAMPLAAALWVLWAAFLIWMMILRIRASGVH